MLTSKVSIEAMEVANEEMEQGNTPPMLEDRKMVVAQSEQTKIKSLYQVNSFELLSSLILAHNTQFGFLMVFVNKKIGMYNHNSILLLVDNY